MIPKTLKISVKLYVPYLVFEAKNVSAQSLYAADAMDILWSGVDSYIIKLIGSWYIDEIIRYLHIQAEPSTSNF